MGNPQHHVFQLQAKQTRTPSSINLPRKYLSIPIVKMKSASMIAVGAFAFTAVAQLESLPSCGQTCITNMLGLAPSLGCGATDAACLCGNVNFAYGIRDCSNAACGSDVAPSVIAYGVAYYSSAGVAIGGSATATGSDVGSATVITTATSPTGTETSTVTGTGAVRFPFFVEEACADINPRLVELVDLLLPLPPLLSSPPLPPDPRPSRPPSDHPPSLVLE